MKSLNTVISLSLFILNFLTRIGAYYLAYQVYKTGAVLDAFVLSSVMTAIIQLFFTPFKAYVSFLLGFDEATVHTNSYDPFAPDAPDLLERTAR